MGSVEIRYIIGSSDELLGLICQIMFQAHYGGNDNLSLQDVKDAIRDKKRFVSMWNDEYILRLMIEVSDEIGRL